MINLYPFFKVFIRCLGGLFFVCALKSGLYQLIGPLNGYRPTAASLYMVLLRKVTLI